MSKPNATNSIYVDAFLRHDGRANAWALMLDPEGRTVLEVIRNVPLPQPGMRAARLAAVRIAMDEAYKAGAREIDVMLPDASLAMALSVPKPVEKALTSQFLSIMALKHAFKRTCFLTGTIDTLSTLSLGMA